MVMTVGDRWSYDTTHTKSVSFYDHHILTTVTKDPNSVTTWISETNRQLNHRRPVVGLDVEWTPSFLPAIENRVAIIQLCFSNRCLIFQIIHAHYIPRSLFDFLNNPSYTFTGVGIRADVEKLVRHYGIGLAANVVELGWLAAEVYGEEHMKVVMGMEVEKPRNVAVSKWDNRWLSPEQMDYASIDGFLSYEIGRRLFLIKPEF
ncbi:hypothetical protein L6452_42447 [Arctium lappa]|uniref:Uncharacterized protein n=2 Tax=Arctium lappa TaxID=4217 RepID=A0ACB8XIP6_ARCLA|nr:hypothetical protein L6452_42446 [Arctium lappa]KAI3667390.1 hypothetical protein L6452_42447 [Arctium lappa]